jgi:hypothetical protein
MVLNVSDALIRISLLHTLAAGEVLSIISPYLFWCGGFPKGHNSFESEVPVLKLTKLEFL